MKEVGTRLDKKGEGCILNHSMELEEHGQETMSESIIGDLFESSQNGCENSQECHHTLGRVSLVISTE